MSAYFSIGNILTATEAQFEELYQRKAEANCPPNLFQYTCNERRAVADCDRLNLQRYRYNVGLSDVSNWLFTLLGKTKEAFVNTDEATVSIAGTVFSVMYTVSEMGQQSCPLCDSYVADPFIYKISNTKESKEFEISLLTLHMIREHHYCGQPGTQVRIDPIKIMETLPLYSAQNVGR